MIESVSETTLPTILSHKEMLPDKGNLAAARVDGNYSYDTLTPIICGLHEGTHAPVLSSLVFARVSLLLECTCCGLRSLTGKCVGFIPTFDKFPFLGSLLRLSKDWLGGRCLVRTAWCVEPFRRGLVNDLLGLPVLKRVAMEGFRVYG